MLHTALERLKVKGKSLLPIVQGGMGVGISAHRLAGTVASLGAFGTISSVDLRRHHPDLMEETGRSRDKGLINKVNLIALDREIQAARKLSDGGGAIGVNVMKAVEQYPEYIRQSCESGADAVVVGAGLPLDLPDLTTEFPKTAIIPILSDVRGIAVILKKWMRKNRLPDAIVIENPRFAGGHLGSPTADRINDPAYAFPTVLEGTKQLLKELGLEQENIPLITAGGIHSHEQFRELLSLGASAVQMGTPFAVSEEGDAHINFKRVLAEAKPEDIVTFMSVAGLPARAVRTPWLDNYLKNEAKLQNIAKVKPCTVAFDCLAQCGLRDGISKQGQFCIDTRLAYALAGDVNRGLFFRGADKLPFGNAIRPVRELLEYMLTGLRPALAAVASPSVRLIPEPVPA